MGNASATQGLGHFSLDEITPPSSVRQEPFTRSVTRPAVGAENYPRYATYSDLGKTPSFFSQEFPQPDLREEGLYYPIEPRLEPYFSTLEQSRMFGAARFCGFLMDTIEVEQNLVIPAVAAVRRLPYMVPDAAMQDLFAAVADEGFHAEQSLYFLKRLRDSFGLPAMTQTKPLFLRRLESQRATESHPMLRELITLLNGIVTETRISVELSRFANDDQLAGSVRRICQSHAYDEAIHASQFRALGSWLWSQFDDATRNVAARFIAMSTVARSLPDLARIAEFLRLSTHRSEEECLELVTSAYSDDDVINEMLFAARPTIEFFRALGTEAYFPFQIALNEERERFATSCKRT